MIKRTNKLKAIKGHKKGYVLSLERTINYLPGDVRLTDSCDGEIKTLMETRYTRFDRKQIQTDLGEMIKKMYINDAIDFSVNWPGYYDELEQLNTMVMTENGLQIIVDSEQGPYFEKYPLEK